MKNINTQLSVVVITKNNAELLPWFLDAAAFADEIIIVDDYSTDQTQKIAQKYGATVYEHRFDGFGNQKRFGLSKVKTEWILLLDVDEIVSDKLQQEIMKVIPKTSFDAFAIPYQNHFLGHPLQTLEQYSKVRLFRKTCGTVQPRAVHEEIVVKGSIGNLTGRIFHYSYRTMPQILMKFAAYGRVEAHEMYANGQATTLSRLTLYPLHMFWSIFVRDKGYRDGVYGLLLALCFAYYELMRYIFLWKWQNTPKRVTIVK